MEGEWHSDLPDGRQVVVRRRRDYWSVSCGKSEARSTNLDVALAQAIRAETEVAGNAHEIDYATWIRGVADALDLPPSADTSTGQKELARRKSG
jgi:hypothetical protein